jgi:DNA-binding MarR family transcriptional regulator
VIDRLVAKGYLRRVADPADRRRVMVELTDELEELAGRFYGPLAEQAFPFLSRYSNSELELIADFMRSSTAIVEKRAAEIRAELAAKKRS